MDYAHIASEGLTIAVGVGIILFAYRGAGKKSIGGLDDDRRAKRRRSSRTAGLMLIGYGVMKLLWFPPPEVASHASLDWRAISTTDGVLTVKMPGEATVQTGDDRGPNGPTKFVKQLATIYDGKVIFSISERHYLDEDVQIDKVPYLAELAKATLAQTKGTLVAQREVRRDHIYGQEMTIRMPNGFIIVTQLFQEGQCMYQLIVVTPGAMKGSPIVREFLDSLVVAGTAVGPGRDGETIIGDPSPKIGP